MVTPQPMMPEAPNIRAVSSDLDSRLLRDIEIVYDLVKWDFLSGL